MSFFKNLLGQKPVTSPDPDPDSDFADYADFADAPSPSPVSIPVSTESLPSEATSGFGPGAAVPYTKWYRVWERSQLSDFQNEFIMIPFIILAVLIHRWGMRKNRRSAKRWIVAHGPSLKSEFSLVGCGRHTTEFDAPITIEDELPADLLKERSVYEYQSYATGRQNVAWVDLKLNLYRLPNPIRMVCEWCLSQIFDGFPPPRQFMESILYPFDGNEKKFVMPDVPGSDEVAGTKSVGGSSTYTGFVFAIVHKNAMRRLRQERYDISLTYTKDHAKLPAWASVMSEAAEITDSMLTKELLEAIDTAGEALEYLIVTDQPIEKPNKLDDAVPRKRLYLRTSVPFDDNYVRITPLFEAFLRLPDRLIQNASHFRPEVVRKLTQTREAESKKLRRLGDEEAEEERKKLAEKVKKEERDRKTRGMTAEEQKKFLEKENERKRKKDEKKMTRRG